MIKNLKYILLKKYHIGVNMESMSLGWMDFHIFEHG